MPSICGGICFNLLYTHTVNHTCAAKTAELRVCVCVSCIYDVFLSVFNYFVSQHRDLRVNEGPILEGFGADLSPTI